MTDSLSISVTETKSSTEKDRDKKDKSKKPSLSLPVVKLSFQRQLYAILLCQCQPVLWDGMSPSEWGNCGYYIRIDCSADSVRSCTSNGFIHTLVPSLPLCLSAPLSLYHRKLPPASGSVR